MGMMGRLSEHDKKELSNAVYGIAMNDIGMIEDAVLAIVTLRVSLTGQSCTRISK